MKFYYVLGCDTLQSKKNIVFKVLFFIAFIVLLITSFTLRRDYQDSWVLEGLIAPFAFFGLTFIACFLTEDRPKWLVVLACMYVLSVALVPALKYVWFQGVAIDQHAHYELAKTILQDGLVPYDRTYSNTPIMHIAIAIFSMITGFSIVDSFKIFPVIIWVMYPVTSYIIARKLFPDKVILSKYILLIASLTLPTISYVFVGGSFGFLMVFLLLLLMVSIIETHKRGYLFFFLFGSFILVAAHSFSSIIFLFFISVIFLIVMPLFSHVPFKSIKSVAVITDGRHFKRLIIILLTINIAWLSLKAENLLNNLGSLIQTFVLGIAGSLTEIKQVIPSKFFDLSIVDRLQVVVVFNGMDFLIIGLAIIGLMISMKKFDNKSSLNFIRLFFISALGLLLTQVFINFNGLEYIRIIWLMSVVCSIFAGVTLFQIDLALSTPKISKIKKPLVTFFVVVILFFSSIEYYSCQPLIPSVEVTSPYGSNHYPIVEMGNVNSIYQRSMIKFAEMNLNRGVIVSDRATVNQICSENYTFYRMITWYYPHGNNTEQISFDYFLIHLPGKSGVFSEPVEDRTTELILAGNANFSIVYNNGESFIAANTGLSSSFD